MVSDVVRRLMLPLLVFVMGTGATLLVCRRYEQSVHNDRLNLQSVEATAYLRNLELGLASVTDFNEGLAAHVTTSQPLDRRSFDGYIAIREAFAPQPGLQSVAYLPRRPDGERRSPSDGRQSPSHGVGRPDGDLPGQGPAVRAVSTGSAIVQDVPTSLEAMHEAASAASTIAVPYESGNGVIMLALFTPVYAPAAGAGPGHVSGFVRSTFELERTIRNALGRPFGRKLDLEIHDMGSGGTLVYDDDGAPRASQHESLLVGADLPFAGRRWNVQFFHKATDAGAWAPGRGLVLLSGLLMSYLLAMATQRVIARLRRSYTHGAFAQNLHKAFEHHPFAVYYLDLQRRFVNLNEKALAEFGLSRDELLGLSSESLIAPEFRDLGQCHWEAALEGRAASYDTVLQAPDGCRSDVNVVLVPMISGGVVAGVLGIVENITERKLNEQKLEQLANHDSLTGLPNRAFFLRQLDQALARSAPGLLAVVYFDIDRFKSINDAWGHHVGDRVIRIFARRARRLLRQSDVLGRLGGDEFVFFAEGLSRRGVEGICERLVATVRRPIRVGRELVLNVSTSVGIAFHRPGMTADELLREADQAMYRVKAAGRDGLHMAQG